MQVLGEDVSEELARVAAAFRVIRTIRRKLVCPCCSTITQPPMPGLPIERSIAHPSLLADILVSKYADHQPLYRQSAIAARDGVTLDRPSMGRWVGQCEALCARLTEALRRYTVAATKLHADDTPIPVLSPGNRKTRTGRLWVYVRDDHRSGSTQPASVWFAYSPNRQGIHPQTHLADFKGILQADAYAGFDELFRDGSIREAACHAHARRKFYDIHVRTPSDTTQKALEYIGGLYDIEASIRGKPAAEQLRIRRGESQTTASNLRSVAQGKPRNAVVKVRYSQGNQLLAEPVERANAVLRRRYARDRQQHRRKRAALCKPGSEEFFIRRLRQRRRTGSRHVLADRNLCTE
jgi:transposase